MTREQLEQYRSNKREIRKLKEALDNLAEDESLIGNSVILNYTKGYPKPESVIGHDKELEIKKRSRIENLRAKIQAENDNIEEYIFSISDGETRMIFYLYFIEGISQEKVAREVGMDQATVSRKIKEHLNHQENRRPEPPIPG